MKTLSIILIGFALVSAKSLMACEECPGELLYEDEKAINDASNSRNMQCFSYGDQCKRSIGWCNIVIPLHGRLDNPNGAAWKALSEFEWMDKDYLENLYQEAANMPWKNATIDDRTQKVITVAIKKLINCVSQKRHVYCHQCHNFYRQENWPQEEHKAIIDSLEKMLRDNATLRKEDYTFDSDFASTLFIAALCVPKIEIDFVDDDMAAHTFIGSNGVVHVVFPKDCVKEKRRFLDAFRHEMGHATDFILGIAPVFKTITFKGDLIKDLYCIGKDIMPLSKEETLEKLFPPECFTNSAAYQVYLQWNDPIEAWQMQGFTEIGGIFYKNERCDRVYKHGQYESFLCFFHKPTMTCADCKEPWAVKVCCDALKLLHAFPSLGTWKQELCSFYDADVLYEKAKDIRVKELRFGIVKAFHPDVLQKAIDDPDVCKTLTEEDMAYFMESIRDAQYGCCSWCPIF